MKKLLFATLALTLVLVTGCKKEETKTDPQQQETKISCTIYYAPETEIMKEVDVEIYVNDSLVCTLGDSIKEYKNTFDKNTTATIKTKPVIYAEEPTDTFDIKYTFKWSFSDTYTASSNEHTPNYEECPPEYWESDMKPDIEKALTKEFVIENGKVPSGPVQ